MPVEQVPQPCEVCGVETVQRCSSCDKAGIDLFFCSKDHQKLVWPAHKPVCGPGKAHPFPILPLSQDEIAWIKTQLDEPNLELGLTMRQELDLFRQDDRPVESLLHELTVDSYLASNIVKKELFVHWVRAKFAGQSGVDSIVLQDAVRIMTGDSNHFSPRLAAQHSAGILLHLGTKFANQRMDLVTAASPWFSRVQHKACIISRLDQLALLHDDRMDQYEELAARGRARLHAWIQAGAGTGDPRIERALASFPGPAGQSES
ncbi:hypothetical protein JCM8208_002837 [Rhodotorula glutinis]